MARIAADALQVAGSGLSRPECVLSGRSGDVYVSDWRGGVSVVRADGGQHGWLAQDCPVDLKPNGIAFDDNAGFLIANLGDDGGVWRLATSGETQCVADRLEGRRFPPANFVEPGLDGELFVTISTLHTPRQSAWRPAIRDGLVVLVRNGKASIAAEGLHYTNEARIDPTGTWLYVVETFGQRLIRFPLRRDRLGKPECVAQFGARVFPDGFAFDAEGGIWVTSLVSNALIRVTPEGRQDVMFTDTNDAHLASFAQGFAEGVLPHDALGPIPNVTVQHATSLAFGGPQGTRIALGNLHNPNIFLFDSDIPGAPLPHWGMALP